MVVKDAYLTWGNSSLGLVLLKLFINTMVVKDVYRSCGNSSLGFVEAVYQNNGSERCISYMGK